MKKLIVLLYLSSCFFGLTDAQNSGQVQTVQPKIMVIPFTKEGEDIRTILEADANKRIAVTKIKEGFDNRGFTTVDFFGKLKSAIDNQALTSNNQSDLKSQVIQMSGADIYVVAEVLVNQTSSGTGVTLILTAHEISTGNSLTNKVCESGKYFTSDIGLLCQKSVNSCIEDFLNVMQAKFTDIVNNGRSIIIEISPDANATNNLETMVGDLPMSDWLEVWMSENAFKNNYHIQGTTATKMVFDDVRIPLKDPTSGANYNVNKFALKLFLDLKAKGITISKDTKGNTVLITLK